MNPSSNLETIIFSLSGQDHASSGGVSQADSALHFGSEEPPSRMNEASFKNEGATRTTPKPPRMALL